MLHLHHSNQLEKLMLALRGSYGEDKRHPFTSYTIICETNSLARWIKLQFCNHDGIASLIETKLPATWLWEQTRKTLEIPPGDDPHTREILQWQLHSALGDSDLLTYATDSGTVTAYLEQDTNGLKRWQLAGHLADYFDRYQYYRPEMITEWSQGRDNQWQAALWRKIVGDSTDHRVALMRSFLEQLQGDSKPLALPPRIDLFSIHNLPPLLLEAYISIARHIPVHIWQLAPTPEYWADLVSTKQKAKKQITQKESTNLYEEGNPLLMQWGKQGQSFQDLLISATLDNTEYSDNFIEPLGQTLLEQVQRDIYQATIPNEKEEEIQDANNDHSLEIHICHSAMRECQVLRDNLLRHLQDCPSLNPEDIIVLVPEISQYAPYIRAVFGQSNPRLPFNLNDTTVADEHPLTLTFLELLDLATSRFSRAQILDLARLPEVMQKFQLDDEDITFLEETFDTLKVYWGFSGKDKADRLKLPAIDKNTWNQAFQRLMTGYARGNAQLWNSIAPLPLHSSRKAESIARFYQLLNTLHEQSLSLHHLHSNNRQQSPSDWARLLKDLCNSLFSAVRVNTDENRLQSIYDTIAELEKTHIICSQPISLAAVRDWLHTQLESNSNNQANFYSGGITFCGLKPLRGVPFDLVCMMGMHDSAYPGRKTKSEYDLMAQTARLGDPDPVQEDRYIFLETLLAARQKLIISYTGKSVRKNEEIPASSVVQELIDYIKNRYQCTNSIISEHPLQAFNPRNFTPDNEASDPTRHLSFDQHWRGISQNINEHTPPVKSKGWPAPNLTAPKGSNHNIALKDLTGLLSRPVRQFIQKRLKIYSPDEHNIPDTEPFKLESLQKWTVSDFLIKNWLDEQDGDEHMLLSARGLLTHGEQGLLDVQELRNEQSTLRANLKPYHEKNYTSCDINIPLNIDQTQWHISGQIHDFMEGEGIIRVSASKFKPGNLLTLWIEHLCQQVCNETNTPAHLFSNKSSPVANNHVILKPVDTEMAKDYLETILACYSAGLTNPLPMISSAGYTFATSLHKDNDEDTAIQKANKNLLSELYPGSFSAPSSDMYFYKLLLRNNTIEFDQDCVSLARQIMLPLVEHKG